MNRAKQLEKAKNLGIKAFHNGARCSPYLDQKLMNMFKDRKIGKTPINEASTVDLLTEWQKHWTIENLVAPVRKWH